MNEFGTKVPRTKMIIGIPKEIKANEYRVAILPGGVRSLVNEGHQVLIQAGAGIYAGYPDRVFRAAGAKIIPAPDQLWEKAEMIVKVKEPQRVEYQRMRRGQILFCFLHLAPAPGLTRALISAGVNAVALETIQTLDGLLPCLIPMSEIAGRMAVQAGASYLMLDRGGPGILLSGAPGVPPGKVVVIGAGTAGTNAARLAEGMGAQVIVLDINLIRLEHIDDLLNGRVITVMSDPVNLEKYVPEADLLIGAVLVPGARAPVIVEESLVKKMKPGSVIVDIAVDQGGCIATTRPTTHEKPVYAKYGVTHYCVANMPGAVPRTSTQALANATFPYLARIARSGLDQAASQDPALRAGINIYTPAGAAKGLVTNPGVARSIGTGYIPIEKLIAGPGGKAEKQPDRGKTARRKGILK